MHYTNLKNKGLSLLLFFISISSLFAQVNQEDKRTIETQIADLLNRFPSKNTSQHNTAMENMAQLGRDGITQMALMLSENGDNEKLEYALAGFAFYASHEERSNYARTAVQAFGRAIDNLDYLEGRDFLLKQLQWVGKEDATPYVEAYLHDERLSGTASRVLANIGASSSEQALLLALRTSDNDILKKNFIEALGDAKSRSAVEEINPYLDSPNPNLQKVAIYALANIADPSSSKVLSKAAANANYTYEPTNATAMYLVYLNNLAGQGQTKQALKLARNLHKKTMEEDQFHTKAGALEIMARLDTKNSTKILQNAASSPNQRYRAAALKFSLDTDVIANLDSWHKTLERADPDAQVSIIRMLSTQKNEQVTEILTPFLQSPDQEVKLATIPALVLSGENKPLPELLSMIKGASPELLEALRTAFKIMKGDNVTSEIAAILPTADKDAKIILIDVLASRAAEEHMNVVLAEINNPDPEVKLAAFSALSHLATPEHLDELVTLLQDTPSEDLLIKVQEAMITANSLKKNKSSQTEWALETLPKLEEDKQVYLYKVLAHTGGSEALSNLQTIFMEGNATKKAAVIEALNTSTDPAAAEVLLDIARTTSEKALVEDAIKGYINLIPATPQKNEGKVISLRNALEITLSEENKSAAISQMGNYPTFQALIVAGEHLDDPAIQQDAARAVMNIVLENDEIYGDEVRRIVEKTIDVISGQDSQYYKTSLQKYLDDMPEGKGFFPLFNGENLEGWKGVFSNPIKRAAMDQQTLEREQAKADEDMEMGWEVKEGLLIFTGEGNNIATEEEFGDFELFVDWKITEDGDAGVYLRGTPQVQIWDPARVDVGAEVGSGGLYNNETHPSEPLMLADNAIGEWNTFLIRMQGEKVTVYLNGELVVDNVTLENYWDRTEEIFPKGQIELQAHGTYVAYRDIYIRELDSTEKFELSEEEKEDGYEVLFDGTHLDQWVGNKTDYVIEDGVLVIHPDRGGKGNLFTKEEYSDFIFRFEFKLTPGANNGLGIRAPLEGDAAYSGMEIQILDDTADIYKNLKEYQFHGSLYGVASAKRGHLKPVGEWNYQEVRAKDNRIQVELNGTLILDTDISETIEKGTLDGRDHPGLKRDKGHIGFLGHGDVVYFRNIRILDLEE